MRLKLLGLRRRPSSLLLAIVLAAGLAACTDGNAATTTTTVDDEGGPTTSTTTVAADETKEDNGPERLRVGLPGRITTDNWFAARDTRDLPQNRAFLGNSKAGLFGVSLPGFLQIPLLAATNSPVEPFQDQGVWVVEQPLRQDAIWSDGTPVTADDFAFYFGVVREFELGSEHAQAFHSSVVDVSAPDDFIVRVEFSREPSLAVWSVGVAEAPFVPSHFWRERVEEARSAGAEAASQVGEEEAIQSIVDESLADETPDNDLTAEDVTDGQITEYRQKVRSDTARLALYQMSGLGEPSIGPVIVEDWLRGQYATTVTNPNYISAGNENTLFSSGSFRVASSALGTDVVYGGPAEGAVLANYVEGPFVSEVRWIEHDSRIEAYEALATGEIDFVYDPDGVTSGLQAELGSFPGIQFSRNPGDGLRYMAFNLRKAPMSDPVFRQAMAAVINKEHVAESVLDGAVDPAYTIVPSGLTAHYNAEIERSGWSDGRPMSTAERFGTAIQTLEDAGYTWTREPAIVSNSAGTVFEIEQPGEGLTMPNGVPVPSLTILSPVPEHDPYRAAFASHIEEAMQVLGVPVTTQHETFEAIVERTFPPQTPETALEWDMYILGWEASSIHLPGALLRAVFHSDQDMVFFGGFNTTGYRSGEFDAVADRFDGAADLTTAATITREMEGIIARDLPYVPLFRVPVVEAYGVNVEFPVHSILGGHHDIPNVWPNAVRVVEGASD